MFKHVNCISCVMIKSCRFFLFFYFAFLVIFSLFNIVSLYSIISVCSSRDILTIFFIIFNYTFNNNFFWLIGRKTHCLYETTVDSLFIYGPLIYLSISCSADSAWAGWPERPRQRKHMVSLPYSPE